nr:Biomphalaria glabrata methyltransferase-like protein 22; transcript variant X2 [Biomphalaria glabrata]
MFLQALWSGVAPHFVNGAASYDKGPSVGGVCEEPISHSFGEESHGLWPNPLMDISDHCTVLSTETGIRDDYTVLSTETGIRDDYTVLSTETSETTILSYPLRHQRRLYSPIH